jgi:hypothetical protein
VTPNHRTDVSLRTGHQLDLQGDATVLTARNTFLTLTSPDARGDAPDQKRGIGGDNIAGMPIQDRVRSGTLESKIKVSGRLSGKWRL